MLEFGPIKGLAIGVWGFVRVSRSNRKALWAKERLLSVKILVNRLYGLRVKEDLHSLLEGLSLTGPKEEPIHCHGQK